MLDGEFSDISVAGEISGLKLAASGHYYFTLKERESQIKAVAFRSAHRFWKCKPQDGLAVVARGRIDVYEARGEYQLIVEFIEPQGLGALQLAFEQLKKKLAAEGLFAAERKRPLPRFPRRIGIVTSPRGAAIADMVQILTRRFPGLHIRLYPALVQGEGSVEEVVRGIEYFSRTKWPDVVIVGRGGGSLEDLWTFNEEAVARAIAACAVPVISAVGHETDVTIADFVADLRAPTPSAAAELVVCTREELLERIAAARRQGGPAPALPPRHAGAAPAAAGHRARPGHSSPPHRARTAADRRARVPPARPRARRHRGARAAAPRARSARPPSSTCGPASPPTGAGWMPRITPPNGSCAPVWRATAGAWSSSPPSSRNSVRWPCWSAATPSCRTRTGWSAMPSRRPPGRKFTCACIGERWTRGCSGSKPAKWVLRSYFPLQDRGS